MVAAQEERPSSLRVARTIEIEAPIHLAYEALVEQLGPACEFDEGHPMPMKFEAWPGGRWYRDLGDNAGHWWATVQVIKPPKLIELSGPLFMSYPAISHVQYRLTASGKHTTLEFLHRAIGELDPEHCRGVTSGWEQQLQRIARRAAAKQQ